MSHAPKNPETGFAALISLATDVNEVLDKVNTIESASSNSKMHERHSGDSKIQPERTLPPNRLQYALWACAALLVFFLFTNSQSTASRTQTPPRREPASSATLPRMPPSKSTSTPAPTPSSSSFEKPPVGEGHVLSTPQIQWCLREDIRLDAIRPHINEYNESEVRLFNSLIDDRNSRCGNYKYNQNSMLVAKVNVEAMRNEIIVQAISEVKTWGRRVATSPVQLPTPTPKPTPTVLPTPKAMPALARDTRISPSPSPEKPASSVPKPPNTPITPSGAPKLTAKEIREVQQLLKSLGYNPGPIDGKLGPSTKSAIQSFNKDQGAEANDAIDQSLLFRLNFEKLKRK